MPVCSPEYQREARREKHPLAKPADLRQHVLLNLHDAPRRWPWLTWAAWFEAMGVQDLTPASTLTFDQYDDQIEVDSLIGSHDVNWRVRTEDED